MDTELVDESLVDKENGGPAIVHASEKGSKTCRKAILNPANILKGSYSFDNQTPDQQDQPLEASSESSKKKRKRKKKRKKKKKQSNDNSVVEVGADGQNATQEEKNIDDELSAKAIALEEEMMESADDSEIQNGSSHVEEGKDSIASPLPQTAAVENEEEEDDDSEPEQVLEEDYVTVDEDAPSPLAMAGKEEGEIDDDEDIKEEPEMGPFVEPSADVVQKIVKQMEFYFSDANILKDYFLLRRIRKNKGGWLRVKLLSSFKLMTAITEDWRQIVFAIRQKSNLLEIDEEGIRVRRKEGLPEWDPHVYKRTCLVYGFDRLTTRKKGNPEPSQISVSFVRDKLFAKFGDRVKLVRILKPGKEVPLDLKTCVRNHSELGQYLCAVVEFDSIETAEAARRQVDGRLSSRHREWSRSHGLTVKILGKRLREPVDSENYKVYSRVPHSYFVHCHPQVVLPPRHYYRPQPSNTYADKVAGRKRPAPDSYADRARSCPKPDETTAAAAAVAPPAKVIREKRKLVPVPRTPQRRRNKSKSGVKAKESGKSSSISKTDLQEAKETKTERDKSKTRKEEGTQTVEKPRLILIRMPKGPPEEGLGVTWSRIDGKEERDKNLVEKELVKVEGNDQKREEEPGIGNEQVESSVEKMDNEAVEEKKEGEVKSEDEEDVESDSGEEKGSEDLEQEGIDSKLEIENETKTESETEDSRSEDLDEVEVDSKMEGEEAGKVREKKSGLQRRRSVKELVRQFEALSTDTNLPKDSTVVRRSGSMRLSSTPILETNDS